MKVLLALILITCVAAPAWAKLSVCFLGVTPAAQNQSFKSFRQAVFLNGYGGQFYDTDDLSCQEVHQIEDGIETVVFSLSVGEAVTTASGIGVPVSAGLAISAAGLSYASFWISGIRCGSDKVKLQEQIKTAVCDAFADSPNVSCNPVDIQTQSQNHSVLSCQQVP